MSTYLQLVNKVLNLHNEVNLTSSTFTDGEGFHASARDAINYSINEINNEEFEWPFNFIDQQIKTLVAGTNLYSFESDFKVADWNSFSIYNDGTLATGTQKLKVMNKDSWFRWHKDIDFDNITSGRGIPSHVFSYGNNQFGVTPNPDKAYTLKYNYWTVPTDLSAHGDITTIPEMFDHVIVAGAMWYLNQFKSDPNATQFTEEKFKKSRARMRSILINRDEDVTDTVVNFGQNRTASYAINDV